MISLALKSGGSIYVETVATETTLGELVSSQVVSPGREDAEDPFYLVDLGRLIDLHDLWRSELPDVHPFYAVKCNNDPALLQTLAALGCGFDCASKAEIKSILDLGVSTERIIYANPCKQSSHLKYARKRGVATMTFDNEIELYKVKEHYPAARLVLRIRADDPSALCQLGVKFGCTVEEGNRLLLRARELGLCVVGVSFHVGSNSKNPLVFLSALEMAHQIFLSGESLGYHFTILDIGGGFPGTRDSVGFFKQLTAVLRDGLGQYFSGRPELKVISEPGRFFACSTHTLAVNIISKREVAVTTSPETTPTFMYFVNDGVYGSFNCILYDHITPTPFVVKAQPAEAVIHLASLWGPTCDGLDKICDFSLPELQVGEWLYFPDMGAYTVSAASNFNGFVRPTTYYTISTTLREKFLTVWITGLEGTANHFCLPPPLASPPPPLPLTHPSSSSSSEANEGDDLPPRLPLATECASCQGNLTPNQGLVSVF